MMNALTTSFYQLLGDNLTLNADKIAIIDSSASFTYRDIAEKADRLAGFLQQSGVGSGDRVIVHLRKSAAEVAAMFAVAKIGAVIVNVSTQWTMDQLRYVANDCSASAVIVEPRTAQTLSAGTLPKSIDHVVVTGERKSCPDYTFWDEIDLASVGWEVACLDTELAMILYTSGSTGQPKGVMLSHHNILTGARSVSRYLGLQNDDRLLSVLPYSFDYGLNQLTSMMLMGGTVVHQPVALPAEIVSTMARYKVTGVAGVPPLWSQIIRLLSQSPMEFPALRRVTNSGGKIPRNILQLMSTVFPDTEIYLMYGLTEAFRSTYLSPEKFKVKMGAIGRAIPGAEVYVIKHGEGLAGAGEQGELVHRGPLVSLGYWGKPEATAKKIRPCPELRHLIGDEPVVYSGDIVEVDQDGELWFIGRNDTMIKTRGYRVSPDEIEDLIYRSGTVAEVVAFAVDDDELGQAIQVAVTSIGPLDEEDFLRRCRLTMPSYMIPQRLHSWPDGMPRTANGKIDRPRVITASRQRPGEKQDLVDPKPLAATH